MNDQGYLAEDKSDAKKAPNFFQVMMSVAAAAAGVQTDANHDRDFKNGSPLPFIIGGILFTVLFVLTLVSVVIFVLPD